VTAFLATAAVALVLMEAVSYLLHRFVMHGPGWRVHADHHTSNAGFQRNDLYPASFSLLAVALFATGALLPGKPLVIAAGVGITCYGVAYLYVHELCIHERLPVRRRAGPYVRWLRQMHRIHHLYGDEPYGMLLPVVPRELRRRAVHDQRDPFARAANTREIRSRL
jgi:beta-carotene 3-hydroxylase